MNITVLSHILHPENSNGKCFGTILTGNTCVTVLVIGWGVTSDSWFGFTFNVSMTQSIFYSQKCCYSFMKLNEKQII